MENGYELVLDNIKKLKRRKIWKFYQKRKFEKKKKDLELSQITTVLLLNQLLYIYNIIRKRKGYY